MVDLDVPKKNIPFVPWESYMGVSKNSGFSPQIHPFLIGCSIIFNHPFWGWNPPICWKHPYGKPNRSTQRPTVPRKNLPENRCQIPRPPSVQSARSGFFGRFKRRTAPWLADVGPWHHPAFGGRFFRSQRKGQNWKKEIFSALGNKKESKGWLTKFNLWNFRCWKSNPYCTWKA